MFIILFLIIYCSRVVFCVRIWQSSFCWGTAGVQQIRIEGDTSRVQSQILQCKRLTHPETRAVEAARQEGDTASRDTVSQMLITHSVLFVYVYAGVLTMPQQGRNKHTLRGKKMNIKEIAAKLNNGDWEPLYFATEKQIDTLIEQGKIDEDFYSYHQVCQEEMRCMIGDLKKEFS